MFLCLLTGLNVINNYTAVEKSSAVLVFIPTDYDIIIIYYKNFMIKDIGDLYVKGW